MKSVIYGVFGLFYLCGLLWAADDGAVRALREPRAWGAVLKYCVACHGADVIDAADLTPALWQGRIHQCMLYMASRGYPRPTAADREALGDFLSAVTPVYREPPVYILPPERGGRAYP